MPEHFKSGSLSSGSAGWGMAIAADEPRVRAYAGGVDETSTRLSRASTTTPTFFRSASILTPVDVARRLVAVFLDTPFEGGRHQRRLDKIAALDAHASHAE